MKSFTERLIAILFMGCLLSVKAPEPKEELCWASPKDLPVWAEQGNFRFIRIDGGDIEARKAARTWWGQNFTETEKDVLANIYGRDADKLLALLKQAEFNWIWVTWSNGWSMNDEAQNRKQLAELIKKCHENNIRVTAYMSASNMFWWSTFRQEPQSKKWLWRVAGMPVLYGASPFRVLADPSKPEWRQYLLKKAELAIDAGVDAIFYDNIFGDNHANKLLMTETQALAERKAKETGWPKILVYANVHISPGRFDINDQCDLLWDEAGKDNPGVWEGKFQAGNARKIKFLEGAKQDWQPLKFENDIYHCGPRETCIPIPAVQKQSIAEAYAFGATLSRNIEGRFLKGIVLNEKPAMDAWAAIGQYNKFIKDNSNLYHRVTPVARIALLSEDEKNPLADIFLRKSVMFSTKALTLLDKGLPLNNFKVLVVPFNLPKLDEKQRKYFSEFAASGGKIFITEKSLKNNPEFFNKMKPSITLISHKTLLEIDNGGPLEKWIADLNAAAGGGVVSLENSNYLVANVTKKDGADTFMVHLINYDRIAPVENVKIKINLAGFAKDLTGFQVKLLSPDQNTGAIQNSSCSGATCEITVGKVQYYSIGVIQK
jgi:hypothetical protein